MAAVRLSGPERLLAVGRHRVRAHWRTHVCDLPAHRRSLPRHRDRHVARSETAQAAITVFDKAVTAHGVPQRLLSDNGIALNPSRRGYLGRLVEHLSRLGVGPITGQPYKPN